MKVNFTFTGFSIFYIEKQKQGCFYEKLGLMEEYGQIKLSYNTNKTKIRSDN